MLKSKDMLDEINLGLATLQNFIRPYARLNYTDINISAESLVADILNSLYGWNLVNANTIRRNFPCIDLLDTERGVGVQVTSEKGVGKINQTLNCIPRHDLNLKRLIVFTLTPRLNDYNVNSSALDFDHARDVLDFDSVILKAEQSSFDELSRLHVELKKRIPFLTKVFGGGLDKQILNGYQYFDGESGDNSLRQQVIQLIKDDKKELAKAKLDEHAQYVLKETGAMLYNVADLYTFLDPLQAELFYRKAAVIHPEGVASANLHGLNLMRLGQLDEAERTFKGCLKSDDLTLLQREHVNGNLGILAKRRSQYREAVEYLTVALRLTRKDDKEGFANHFNNLGSCYNHLEKYRRAGRCLKIARDLIEEAIALQDDIDERNRLKLKKSNFLTNTAIQLKYLAEKHGEPKLLVEAKSLLLEAIDIAEMLKEKTELARHYGNLSNVLKEMGDFPQAEKYLVKSYEASVENGDHHAELINLINFSDLMIKTQEFERAESYLEEAVSLEKDRYPKLRSEIFENYSVLYKAQGALASSNESFYIAAKIHADLGLPERTIRLRAELDIIG